MGGTELNAECKGWKKYAGAPLCLTLQTIRTGVWKRDKMSHRNPGNFAMHHAKFTLHIRLNPSLKIKVNQG